MREYGRLRGDARLAACAPVAVQTWELRDTNASLRLSESEVEAVVPDIRDFWRDRFFSSEYCKDDTPAAGAHDYLRAVLAAGGEISTSLAGTRRWGRAPSRASAARTSPAGRRAVQLWLKPALADDDDR